MRQFAGADITWIGGCESGEHASGCAGPLGHPLSKEMGQRRFSIGFRHDSTVLDRLKSLHA
jgi:hypothetical protein